MARHSSRLQDEMRDPDFLFEEYRAVAIYNSSDAN